MRGDLTETLTKEVKSSPSCKGMVWDMEGMLCSVTLDLERETTLLEKGCEPLMVRSPLATREVQMSRASPRALLPGLGVRWHFMKQLSTQSWSVVWTSVPHDTIGVPAEARKTA